MKVSISAVVMLLAFDRFADYLSQLELDRSTLLKM